MRAAPTAPRRGAVRLHTTRPLLNLLTDRPPTSRGRGRFFCDASGRPASQPRPAPPAAGPPSFDLTPQNTPPPQVLPNTALDAPGAVAAQVAALSANDTPWPGHGIQTAYAFCRDTGSLDLSTYFRPRGRDAPLRRSLYHEVRDGEAGMREKNGGKRRPAVCLFPFNPTPRNQKGVLPSLPFPSLPSISRFSHFSLGPLCRYLRHRLPGAAPSTRHRLAGRRCRKRRAPGPRPSPGGWRGLF